MTEAAGTDGLRARKRRATENAIETSAVRLALDLGYENVTVEAICDRAEISRSTFFNYFPSRDAAIVGRAIEVLTGAEADAVLRQSSDDLPRGIFLLMFASIGHSHVNTDVLRMRGQLAAEQEIARHVGTILLFESGGRLAAAAAKWLIANPEKARLAGQADREAALAVNSVYAAISAMAGGWIFAEGDPETSVDEFDAAIRDLRTVLTE